MADSCFDNTQNVGGWLKRLKTNKLNGGTQLLQGLLWFTEKTIEQTTEQWTLALKTIELRDTKVQWN